VKLLLKHHSNIFHRKYDYFDLPMDEKIKDLLTKQIKILTIRGKLA